MFVVVATIVDTGHHVCNMISVETICSMLVINTQTVGIHWILLPSDTHARNYYANFNELCCSGQYPVCSLYSKGALFLLVGLWHLQFSNLGSGSG